MEMILIAVGSCLVFLGWKVLNWVWLKPKKLEKCLRDQGLDGNPYRFFYGDSKENAAMIQTANSKPMNFSHDVASRLMPFIQKTINKCGKNSFMWLGPRPTLLIMDSDLIKAAFFQNNDIQKPKVNPILRWLIEGLVVYDGDKWSKHRRIMNPAFHLTKLKDMVLAISETCSETITKWEKLVSKDGSCELDVTPYLQTLTADVISRTAFGSSFEEGKRVFQLETEITHLLLLVGSQVYIPGWRFLPTKLNNKIKRVNKEIKALLLNIINKRQKAMLEGEATQNDLLGILLQSNANEIKEHGDKRYVGMSIEEVVKECKLFYLAGQESTAILLTWTMILLGGHTEWQDRARAEVLEVFGNNRPDFDGLCNLKIVTMILNEVFRLYSPVPMLTRSVENETRIGNLSLPAEVMLGVPIVLLHHDRQVWGEDADKFNPTRFSEGVSKATKNQIAFLPFGVGHRICIGMNLTMLEAKMAISMILQNFSFEHSPSYTHAPTPYLNTKPKYGAHLILRKL